MKHYVKANCIEEKYRDWEIQFFISYPISDTYLMFSLGSENHQHLDELLKMYILGALTEMEFKGYLYLFEAIPYNHRNAKRAFQKITTNNVKESI